MDARPVSLRVGITLSTFTLAALLGCQQQPQDHLALAKAAIAAHDIPSAQIHLKNLIAADANNTAARLMLADQFIAANNPGVAIVELKRARELRAPEDEVAPRFAESLLLGNQERQVVEQFANARLQSPAADATLASLVAMAYLRLKEPGLARKAIQRVLGADPSNADALLGSVRVTLAERGRTAALAEANTLVGARPELDEAWTFKGNLHEAAPTEGDQALAAYQRALQINPRQFQALLSTASVLLNARDLVKARAALDALAKVSRSSPQAMYFEARYTYLKGNLAKAREQFAELLRLMPENVLVLQAAGVTELALQAPIKAEGMLARAVSLAPDNQVSRYYLAIAQLQSGRPEAATNTLSSLVEKSDASPEMLVVAAKAKLMQGDAAGADALYKRAEAFNPNDTGIRTELAVAKLVRGEADLAIRELQVIASSEEGIEADLRIVSARLARGETAEALQAIDRIEAKRPGQASVAELRGRALLSKGDTEGAHKAFELALSRDRAYAPALAQITTLDVRQGKGEAAMKRLNELIAAEPNNSTALTILARVKAATGGSAADVLALLERATRVNPGDVNAWLALMERQFQSGDMQTALNVGQSANAQIPDNVQLLELLGRTQIKAGQLEQASSTFARLVKAAPRAASGYMGQAATFVAKGDLEPAAKAIERLLEIDPSSVDASRMAADIAIRRRQFPQALAIARGLQQRLPDASVGYQVEGLVEQGQGKWAAAAAAYRKGLTKNKPGELAIRLHLALLRAGAKAEVQQHTLAWTKSHPTDTEFLAHLGDIALFDKDLPAARALFERILAIDGENAVALNNLAWVMLQQKDGDALKMAQKAVALQPNQPDILDTLAQIHLSRREFPVAVETLKKAINRAADAGPLRLSLARVYAQAGDRANAIAELEGLVALGKSSPYYPAARKLLAEQRKL